MKKKINQLKEYISSEKSFNYELEYILLIHSLLLSSPFLFHSLVFRKFF